MTDSCEIDIEVGGSVGISDVEERVVEYRRASTAIEESAKEETKRRCAVEKTVAWKIFKSIIFVICLVFLVIQSVEFLGVYYKYPTKIETEITLTDDFKLPAITVCFRNTISFKDFCFYEPERCERPSDMEEFCRKHPILCVEDTSNLTIPMQDRQTRKIMQTYLFNDSYNDASLFRQYNYPSKARTFVDDIDGLDLFLKCYSDNLHLYRSGSKPETKKLEFKNNDGYFLKYYVLDMRNIQFFYPPYRPVVFIGIHSPFVPLDLEFDLYPMRPGAKPGVYIELEKEEHLLPPPYQTDCRDNGPSQDAEEATNPNSFQVCVDMCESEHTKALYGCDWGLTMVSSPSDLCVRHPENPDLSKEQLGELANKYRICLKNCKQGCLKLQYKYKIKDRDMRGITPDVRDTFAVGFYVRNTEVTILRHVPVYGSGDVFSHIGGLLGCWLGVSVFTFTDIMEKFFRKVVRWKRRSRRGGSF